MMERQYQTREILEFYLDNDLDEVISDVAQNCFLQKEVVKQVVAQKPAMQQKAPVEVKKEPAQENNKFMKPQGSTNQAISTLAQKLKDTNRQVLASSDKFIPLNEIIDQAKSAAQAAQTLDELKQAVESFEGCNLKKMATNTVFADGNANAKMMVIGEAPGNDEDLQGRPFCGDVGKLLDAMFGAINVKRESDIYLGNVIFWRPPGNRRATQEELAICRPFLERQIQLVNPEIIVLVGSSAMSAILGIEDNITSVRGKLMDFTPDFLEQPIKSFTIFHPAYLMRQPGKKKLAWQDMLALEGFLKK